MIRPLFFLPMAALLAVACVAGCAQTPPAATAPSESSTSASSTAAPADPAAAPALQSPTTAQDVFRFRIGALDAVALKDGDIEGPNDGKTFLGQPTAAVAALLSAAGQPTDVVHMSIQPLLVRSGARVLLFDTGAADASFARAGRLPDALRAAGVEPGQVTDIFISHRHQDHAGGLLTRDGKLAFPDATIHLAVAEWKALQGERESAALATAIAPKVAAFEPGATLVPGVVTAVVDDGHTPGHSAYEIASGDERLLYIGDTAHHFVISVQRPDWTIAYDENAPLAQSRRRALLQRAADGDLRVYAVHFPFPGLGHIKTQGDGFVWVPER